MYLTAREFFCPEFYAFLQKEFDTSRHFLKHCGRPTSEYDRWLIDFHREQAQIFRRLLHLGENRNERT